jgi:hypothetical protein
MNREDILRMGRQAGAFIELAQEKDLLWLERFAAHVAKHTLANIDPSSFMTWQEGYEAGAFAEREACAKLCDDHCGWTPRMIGSTIRARGNVATNDTSQEHVDETTKQRHDAPPQPVIDKSAAVRIATALGWTPQRTWVGLTDEERHQAVRVFLSYYRDFKITDAFVMKIEMLLKEKNT